MFGLKVIAHPLLANMRFAVLKLSPQVPVSDAFRRDFDAWLLEMFGAEEMAFICDATNTAYVSPKAMAMLRLKKRERTRED